MPLVSYAQNGEDVVLHRALKDIAHGHYIDIGANDPEADSVTKIFYDRGWSGVNVEASKSSFDRLVAERTRDLNLHVAVSARAGVVRLHDVSERGLSTLDVAAATDAERRGFTVDKVDVPALSLADICRDLPFDTTHFLKIDVEGGERDVLLGADFTVFRPWIVVIEATRPNSSERVDEAWRGLLEEADYSCALFDGLNLYFVAREQSHLRGMLEAPANILDDYLPLRFLGPQQAERDAVKAEHARVEAAFEAERSRIEASREAERARAEGVQLQCDQLNAHVRELSEELLESRVRIRVTRESLQRELDKVRREGQLEAERHFAELMDARDQLARLAHFQAQGELLRRISDLTGAGSHLEDRGAELLELRASLIAQANAWQAEVEHLQARLGDALARSDLLHVSTSWRVTSPLRGLRRATHILRREPHRLPGLMRHRVRAMLGRPGSSVVTDDPAAEPAPPSVEQGTRALVSVAARLDGEIAIIADLLGSMSSVLGDDASNAAGPCYGEARLDERLTRWILADVVRQRRAAL